MKKSARLPVISVIAGLALVFSSWSGAEAVGTGPGTVELVSQTPAGEQTPHTEESLLSGNGNVVALRVRPLGVDNPTEQTFVRDLSTGAYRTFPESAYPLAISDTGRFVTAWYTGGHLYRIDTLSGESVVIDQLPDGRTALDRPAIWPTAMSGDGRYVLFRSMSSKLVANDTNGQDDLFLRDVQAGTTVLVSKSLTGGPVTGTIYRQAKVSTGGNQVFFDARTSAMGVAGARDYDVFRWDRGTDQVTVASARTDGTRFGGAEWQWDVSRDGKWLAMSTERGPVGAETEDVPGIYRINTQTHQARLIAATRPEWGLMISADGQCVGYEEYGRYRTTLYYPATRSFRRIPTGADGLAPNVSDRGAVITGISRDCATVLLESRATNLVASPQVDGRNAVYVWRDN